MPRRDEKMVVDAKGMLIDIVNQNHRKWSKELLQAMQRDFVLRLEHYRELRRHSVQKGTAMTEEDVQFEELLMAKAVKNGLFSSVQEMAAKVVRGEEETLRLGRTLDVEIKKEKKAKLIGKQQEAYGYNVKKPDYDVDGMIEMYIESGMTPSQAKDRVKIDLMELVSGEQLCHVCKKAVRGRGIIKAGVCYCAGCWKEEEKMGTPYEINGVKIKCSVCEIQIRVGWTLWFECPEGEDMNEKCTWWCRRCYFKMPEHQELKAKFLKKLNGRTPRKEQ